MRRSPHSLERFAVPEPVGDEPLLRWCSLGLARELAAAFASTRGEPRDRCRAVFAAVSAPAQEVLRERRDEALVYAERCSRG